MKLGILGLPQAGKTTIFNALTRGDKPVGGARQVGRFEVQTAVVPVPDERVDRLSAMFKPRKTIYARVDYADIAGYCRSASIEDIRKHAHVLTPGRYVGAEAVEDDSEPFEDKMKRLVATLREQQAEGAKLDAAIAANLKELGYGS